VDFQTCNNTKYYQYLKSKKTREQSDGNDVLYEKQAITIVICRSEGWDNLIIILKSNNYQIVNQKL